MKLRAETKHLRLKQRAVMTEAARCKQQQRTGQRWKTTIKKSSEWRRREQQFNIHYDSTSERHSLLLRFHIWTTRTIQPAANDRCIGSKRITANKKTQLWLQEVRDNREINTRKWRSRKLQTSYSNNAFLVEEWYKQTNRANEGLTRKKNSRLWPKGRRKKLWTQHDKTWRSPRQDKHHRKKNEKQTRAQRITEQNRRITGQQNWTLILARTIKTEAVTDDKTVDCKRITATTEN